MEKILIIGKRKKAKKLTSDVENPFFRMLQILEHMRR